MFPISSAKHLQVTPVVVKDGVMFVTMTNEVYALDAARGRQIWHYARPPDEGRDRRRRVGNQPRRGGARRQGFHRHRRRPNDRPEPIEMAHFSGTRKWPTIGSITAGLPLHWP